MFTGLAGSMDSNSQSPPHNNLDSKNVFRKPSGDAGSRNYRRRSPIEGSASPDGWDLLCSWPCLSVFLSLQVMMAL